MYKKIVAIIFCIIILYGFWNLWLQFQQTPIGTNFARFCKGQLEFSKNLDTVLENFYDKIQLILNKKELANFTYYQKDDGMFVIVPESEKEKALENAKIINKFNKEISKRNIPLIYFSMPEEIKENDNFENIDYGNEAADLLISNLDSELKFIDLRKEKEIFEIEENFYKTDHHWNLETVFEAFKVIARETEKELNLEFPLEYFDLRNYKKEEMKKSFFGSKGVNVGENLLSKEDFYVLYPNYDTSFEYIQYDTDGKEVTHTKGDFYNAFIDKEKLYKASYINKYNVFLYGGRCENIITNKKSDNNEKALLISSSYGRALTPYLSQCFEELIYIDPREGRFEKDVIKYIEEYKPDIIFMLYKSVEDLSYIISN